MHLILRILFLPLSLFYINLSKAQLVITEQSSGRALVDRLVGSGVRVSNITLTNTNPLATGFFNNLGGTNIGIDSGIIITNGRAQSDFRQAGKIGADGNGTFQALSSTNRATTSLGLPGDIDLANSLGANVSSLHDAVVLEFDFVPLGDTVKFNYILGSEEYTIGTVCTFNDAFAFYISGPGITGLKNIAIIPGTTLPVSIKNVNDVPGGSCPNNTSLYIDNRTNTNFTYDGHTRLFTAISEVQPCQTYHLKLVIADYQDFIWDSGVFLEAKSLTSNVIQIDNLTQTDPLGNSYLVEGCATGSFQIRRPFPSPSPLPVSLSYGGTALNGIDVQALPTLAVIPANSNVVTVNVLPIVDNIPEGIEELKIFALAGCNSGIPTDSATIQIRDYDILGIIPDSAGVCTGGSVQLTASGGYSFYQWDANSTLSNTSIRNPVASPVNDETVYICAAQEGNCHAKDSALIKIKKLDFVSKTDINCKNGNTGVITVDAGWEWQSPPVYSINNGPFLPDSSFINLTTGTYKIKVNDATGCSDSLTVTLIQAYPDLVINSVPVTPATCSGLPDGTITINNSGGLSPYNFSTDGTSFQQLNTFNVLDGSYAATVKDVNGCMVSQPVIVPFLDTVNVDAGIGSTICEGKSTMLNGSSNAAILVWSPAIGLSSLNTLSTAANPTITTKYYLTATSGVCTKKDSVVVIVNPAPLPNAGPDIVTCFGFQTQLKGSGGTEFFWRPSSFLNNDRFANPVSSVQASFRYFLWTKDGLGCESLKPDTLNIKVIPQVKIFAGNDTTVSVNQPLQLRAIETGNSGVTQWSWSPSLWLSSGFIYNPVSVPSKDITYIVTGTTPDGCFATDDIKVRVINGPEIYVPNSFTPNGDGLNDLLKPIPVGLKQFNYFKIFTRWGQLIFSSSNPSVGWDGTIKGVPQANAGFVWIAEGVDYKGNIIQRRGITMPLR